MTTDRPNASEELDGLFDRLITLSEDPSLTARNEHLRRRGRHRQSADGAAHSRRRTDDCR